MLARCGFEVTGRLFYGLAITLTALSTTSAILQATPLVVVAGAALVFGERVTPLRWLAVARTRAMSKSDTWAAMIGAILLSEAEIRLEAGDAAGAETASRELVAHAARTNLDEHLRRGLEFLPRVG